MVTATKTVAKKPKKRLARIRIDDNDIKPRSKGKKKQYKLLWSRKNIATFMKEQMFLRGYFVGSAVVKKRNPAAGRAAAQHRYVGSRGDMRGVWAWSKLADHADISVTALKTLAAGGHKRSPEFKTVVKVFKALAIELVGVQVNDWDVSAYVKAF